MKCFYLLLIIVVITTAKPHSFPGFHKLAVSQNVQNTVPHNSRVFEDQFYSSSWKDYSPYGYNYYDDSELFNDEYDYTNEEDYPSLNYDQVYRDYLIPSTVNQIPKNNLKPLNSDWHNNNNGETFKTFQDVFKNHQKFFNDYHDNDFGIKFITFPKTPEIDFGKLPTNYSNSTYKQHVVDNHHIAVNQTVHKKSGDGFQHSYHHKTTVIRPHHGEDQLPGRKYPKTPKVYYTTESQLKTTESPNHPYPLDPYPEVNIGGNDYDYYTDGDDYNVPSEEPKIPDNNHFDYTTEPETTERPIYTNRLDPNPEVIIDYTDDDNNDDKIPSEKPTLPDNNNFDSDYEFDDSLLDLSSSKYKIITFPKTNNGPIQVKLHNIQNQEKHGYNTNRRSNRPYRSSNYYSIDNSKEDSDAEMIDDNISTKPRDLSSDTNINRIHASHSEKHQGMVLPDPDSEIVDLRSVIESIKPLKNDD